MTNDATRFTDDELLELIREALLSLGDDRLRLDQLSMDAKLSHLGVDSMSAIEMAAYLVDKLGIRLPDDQLSQVSAVRDAADLVRRHAARAA